MQSVKPENLNKLYIDGQWITPQSDSYDTVVNPATEERLATVVKGSKTDATSAILAAKRSFDEGSWSNIDHMQRVRVLQRLYENIASRRSEIESLISLETGYIAADCRGQVDLGLDLLKLNIEVAQRDPVKPLPIKISPTPDGSKVLGSAVSVREPFGVVTAITPYNAGFLLSLVKCAPAILAGNSVILKPSPFTPLQSYLFAELIEELELPKGVFNLVTGDADIGSELTSHPAIDMVSFTGSAAVGADIMAQAAPTLKKVHLELGGKSALIVRDDADIERAVNTGLQAFIQSGQGCALPTRHVVHNSIRDEYVARIAGAVSKFQIGNPTDDNTRMGPLIRQTARERTQRFVEQALTDDADLVHGGKIPAHLDRGYFYEPTIFNNVDENSTLAKQEVFGPILSIIGFDTDDQAISIANNSDYGLSGGIYSRNTGLAFEMARKIRTGTVQINGGPGGRHPHMAFGGYKFSGLGREWGEEGYYEFTEQKSIGYHAG